MLQIHRWHLEGSNTICLECNSFDKNLGFALDTFDNGNIHFLDIKPLNNCEADIYIKEINTYVQYKYCEHLNKNCMGMICSLHHKVHKIRSNHQLLMTQIYLEKFVSWSGYCHYGYYKLGLKINQSMVIIKKRINQHSFSKIFYTGAQGDRLH